MNSALMKRVVCRSFGTSDGVVVESAPIPEPGPGEVLIRTTAANVSFVDRLIVGGGYFVASLIALLIVQFKQR